MKTMTKVAFRKYLNETRGGRVEDGGWKHKNHAFGNRKRAYGDWLYFQDRVMFDESYRLFLEGKIK